MKYAIEHCGGSYEVEPKICWYTNTNNIAIVLIDAGEEYPGEEFGTLTVNAGQRNQHYQALDTNNLPGGLEFVLKHGLGRKTGIEVRSGFCSYPVVEFFPEKLREMDPEGYERWQEHLDAVA